MNNLNYKVLTEQVYTLDTYSLVPIRFEDRYDIMKWRNEQIYHLRQDKILTSETQDNYFNNIIRKLFSEENPEQILFSFLNENRCIGYGGLVHINWKDKNAEISFIMDTSLEINGFCKYWELFLKLIENVAFHDLKLHKIYTYAFDIRPKLYDALTKSGYFLDARLHEHSIVNNEFKDVVIHSKMTEIKY